MKALCSLGSSSAALRWQQLSGRAVAAAGGAHGALSGGCNVAGVGVGVVAARSTPPRGRTVVCNAVFEKFSVSGIIVVHLLGGGH